MRKKYDFYSLCIIPVFTLFLSHEYGLTETNLSVIGNDGAMRLAFLVWGLVTGNYFYLYMRDLLEAEKYEDRWTGGLLLTAWFLFLTAIGLPYIPKKVPLMADLHVVIIFLAIAVMLAVVLRFLLYLQRQKGRLFWAQWRFMILASLISAVLFWRNGKVTSLLEIFATFSVCLFLHQLNRKLEELQENP